jgi:hypothetical protein
LQQFPVTGLLPNGGTSNLVYSGSAPAAGAKMLVVYQGTIGVTNGSALDPVDASLGLAANWAICYDCMGTATNLTDLVWKFYPGYKVTGSGSGVTGTMSGADNSWGWLAAPFCNPTSQDITVQINATVSWDYHSLWDGNWWTVDVLESRFDFANTEIFQDGDSESIAASGSASGVGTMVIPANSMGSVGGYFQSSLITFFGSSVAYTVSFTVSVVH